MPLSKAKYGALTFFALLITIEKLCDVFFLSSGGFLFTKESGLKESGIF